MTMLNRRTFALSATALTLLEHRQVFAQESTPEASPVVQSPDEIFAALLAAPFSSPLLPADTGEIVVSEWIDEGDSDLVDAVGGILYGVAGEGNESTVGAIIVYRDQSLAESRVNLAAIDYEQSVKVMNVTVGGFSGMSIVDILNPDYSFATSAVSVASSIVSGGAEGFPADELEGRSLAHLVALLDHYRRAVGF